MATRAILNFHGLGDPPAWVDESERPYWAPVAAFERLVREAGAAAKGRVAITFDDGNASDLAIAAPVLSAQGVQGTFFLCTDRLGAPGYLDEAGVRALLAQGMRIGSHGEAHVRWTGMAQTEIAGVARRSLARLSRLAEAPVFEVAIPFGAYDASVLRGLRQANVMAAYTSDGGLSVSGAWLRPRLSYRVDRPMQAYRALIGSADTFASEAKARARALARKVLKGC